MKYISETSYNYIVNKYHNTNAPFNPFERFIRNDSIFDPQTGLDGDDIITGIIENDKNYESLLHPIRKARALEYVLKNTRICCDMRDIFPAINSIDRPLTKALIDKWRAEVFKKIIPDVEFERAKLEAEGAVTIGPDYEHSIPMWDRMFALGFSGLLKESENARASRHCTEEEDAFYEGIRISYLSILDFLERLQAQAIADGNIRMADALANLRTEAPKSFYEHLLLTYLYFMISEHIDCIQVRSLSNFDRLFFPAFMRDLSSGITEDVLRCDLAHFLLQFTAIGNYWNQPVYLGGENADGSTVTNILSYIFLDVYNEMGIYNPKIQLKVCASTPKEFLLKALDMIRHGNNSIVFVSDTTMRHALEHIGVDADEARLCNVSGCYEYYPRGSYITTSNYINLMKPLEYLLHNGHDGLTGEKITSPCINLEQITSFEELLAEYKKQLGNLIEKTTRVINGFEDYLFYMCPSSLLSGTVESCIKNAKDILCGGGLLNDSAAMFGFLADTVDSLMMIRKYVFERKELSLPRLVEALDNNYVGYETLRRKLHSDKEKYGNNKERPDALAVDIVNFIVRSICGVRNSPKRGGKWNCGFHVARMSYTQGKRTAASANGRLIGEELSKNISASMGQNREGATAAILSATKIDATAFTSDAALDLGLLPSAVKGEDGLEAMYGLLMTFIRRGGHAIHINVFDADTLRDAQDHPEKYSDLQIRVCGWNVLWNNINKEEQDGFIRQAEALI